MKPLMKYHVTIETANGSRISTWGVFPVASNTKILDGIYNPETKELSILMDSATEQYADVQVNKPNGKYEIQQRKLDQYYRFRLPQEDVKFFLDNYVDNNFEIEAAVQSPLIIDHADTSNK